MEYQCPKCNNSLARIVVCPSCGKNLMLGQDQIQIFYGKQVKCPECQKDFYLQ
ncbi:MAG: MJ0042-type zinc finger domain-containing protein [Candidatus Hodarchaeota archaeon]